RADHTATLLPSGKVLVAGGYNCVPFGGCGELSSAELYDPATGTWTSTGNLNTARFRHTGTLLPNGKVLVVAGKSAELYDPAAGTWSYTASPNIGGPNRATLLLD